MFSTVTVSVVPLLILSISMCATPGFNNLMLAAYGSHGAFRQGLRYAAGAITGANTILFIVAAGIAQAFTLYPSIKPIFGVLGGILLLYIAMRLLLADPKAEKKLPTIGPKGAFFLQILNVKVWISAFSLSSMFLKHSIFGAGFGDFVVVLVVQVGAGVVGMLLWLGIGAVSFSLLKNPRHLKIFDAILALSLAVTAVAVAWESFFM